MAKYTELMQMQQSSWKQSPLVIACSLSPISFLVLPVRNLEPRSKFVPSARVAISLHRVEQLDMMHLVCVYDQSNVSLQEFMPQFYNADVNSTAGISGTSRFLVRTSDKTSHRSYHELLPGLSRLISASDSH